MSPPLVSIDALTKSYGRLTAVADVSLSIHQGEVLGLIGPNGSGKTTLFECIAGLLPYEAGTIRMNHLPADALSAFAQSATARPRRSSNRVGGAKAGPPLSSRDLASQIFYLPDAIAPWPAQTVGWALDFAIGFFGRRESSSIREASPLGLPCTPTRSPRRWLAPGTWLARGARSRAAAGALRDEVVARLDLGPLLASPMGRLSKGQRKRAVLAVGMLAPHPVLLADEPFDGLDLRQTREVGAALRAHAAAGRTLFLSIHQIGDAARICDRFVLLSAGRVCGEGTLPELAARVSSNPSNLEDIFLALT